MGSTQEVGWLGVKIELNQLAERWTHEAHPVLDSDCSRDCARSARLVHAEPSDLGKTPTLYVVGYAHLDTQWRWTYPEVIDRMIPATMQDNFRLIDKYPDYVFNFSGANRYRMMKEYYPADFAKVKGTRRRESGLRAGHRWKSAT